MYRSDFDRCPLDGGELAIAGSDPLIGSQIDRYEIEALIGVGAMGRVYRVHHARLVEKHYALKVLIGDLAASTSMRLRFANEAHAVAKLDHPNVVGIVDFGRTPEGLLYLVMELVEGVSLGAIARRGPMRSSRLLGLARQLCDGLTHAHARGLVHRDFKPDNILIVGEEPDEVARIVDFGLAISPDGMDARLTADGVCCTPAYAAPEQLLGRELDHRVDLYSLGVTLYELACGALPFAGESADIVARKITQSAPSVGEVAPALPRRLVAIIDRLLERDPARRFASVIEVRAALPMPNAPDAIERAPTLLDSKVALVTAPAIRPPRRAARRVAQVALVAGAVAVASVVVAVPQPSELVRSADVRLEPVPENPWIRIAWAAQDDSPPIAIDDESVVRARVAHPVRARVVGTTELVEAPVADEPSAPALDALLSTASPPVVEQQMAPPPPPLAVQAVATPERPRPLPTPNPLRIASLDVEGALPSSVVRRAVERTIVAMHCTGTADVHARFLISDERRANELRVTGDRADCVTIALTQLRTEIAPDVGDAHVTLTLTGSSK